MTWVVGGSGVTRTLLRNGGAEELYGDPTVATHQNLNQRLKIEEVLPKMARRRGLDAG